MGELAKRVIKRVKDHGGRDTKSHVLKHNIQNEDVEVTLKDFKIIGSHFNNSRLKRKIAEELLINQERPILNDQDQTVEVKLLKQCLLLNITTVT